MKKTTTPTIFRLSKVCMMALAVVLFNCKDKDDEPKPATSVSSNENGFVKGKIKGTRQDGTAFEESFEYKVAYGPEFMERIGTTGDYNLDIYRGTSTLEDDPNHVGIETVITNRDQNPTAKIEYFRFSFAKAINGGKLFVAETRPVFEEKKAYLPVSRANNATYKLENYGLKYVFINEGNGNMYKFMDMSGNSIYFESPYTNYEFDEETGEYMSYGNFKYIIDKDGKKMTTSAMFGGLKLVRVEDSNNHAFYDASGNPLSEEMTVPADTQEIKNLKYDSAKGLVTFDYTIKVNELRGLTYRNTDGMNTTNHSLEISGSVSTTAYTDVVMRKSAE